MSLTDSDSDIESIGEQIKLEIKDIKEDDVKVDDVADDIADDIADDKEDVKVTRKIKIKKKYNELYSVNVLTRKVVLSFQEVGSNITQLLEEKLKNDNEGKCVEEGYIKTNSIRIVQYTSGNVNGNNIEFTVLFECLLCFPVEGMKFKTIVKEVTLAGIRSERKGESPVDVFIARDHNFDNKRFNSVREGDAITIRVIGQRYEINDQKISVIADLMYVEKNQLKIKK